jgi:hypothetical protein
MKKSAEQRLRETDPDLMDYLERLAAPLQTGLKKLIEEIASGPDLLKLPETHINLPFYIYQQAFERTPVFKQFHEKTGGDLWDFMSTPEGEIDPALERLCAIGEAFQSLPPSAILVIPRFREGRYLDVRIDLSKSKEALRAEFEEILRIQHGWVEHPKTPRGKKWPESKEEIDQIFHAFDVVEKHGGKYLEATRELFPDPYDKYEADKNLQQVKRWHEKVKCGISALQPS